MKTAYLLCGLPGSGKSTWAKKQGKLIINRDAIRQMIYGGEYRYVKDDEPLVMDMAFSMATSVAYSERDMIIDETGSNTATRAKWVSHLKHFEYTVKCIFFDVPVEECIRRRKIDTKGYDQDWAGVICGMAANFKPPIIDEGYDSLETRK